MYHALLVRIVERLGDLADHVHRPRCGHGRRPQRILSVPAIDELHRNP
ncbi:Uncharacterised protein [Mycobacterium tuberculosis]|uniref:Uncharacterized protein n=1 Tax=Mycobacterium tuberculosis TaxID=1773 RepID=A0A0U0TGX1_MYCTX|nr:hypothetical protein CAB90_02334 [Mycobacterium tuberculosis]COX63492.1 Uncharacterised protein [Mycobacterium tuberculosis]COX65479.1 Uncharacterised protein [Mycobacterium tuberculosis]